MYLKLSVAGHLTLFVARTRGRLWSHRPRRSCSSRSSARSSCHADRRLRVADDAPGWDLVALAWGYAIAWILLLDQIKLMAYRVLDRESARAAA